MERLYQMHVVPDILPGIHPSIDLHVITRTTPGEFIESNKVQSHVVPGAFLRPKQVNCPGPLQLKLNKTDSFCVKTLVPPKLRVKVFHTDVRLYTMLLVDLGLHFKPGVCPTLLYSY